MRWLPWLRLSWLWLPRLRLRWLWWLRPLLLVVGFLPSLLSQRRLPIARYSQIVIGRARPGQFMCVPTVLAIPVSAWAASVYFHLQRKMLARIPAKMSGRRRLCHAPAITGQSTTNRVLTP